MKKTIMTTLLVSSLASLSLITTASAASGKSLNPWQDCGLGAMVFPENGTAAAISNVISDLGTTAVSSNISSQGSCEGSQAKTAMFIKATQPSLEQDIAKGEGEYLSAMLELRGCEVSSHNMIAKAIREDQKIELSDTSEALYNSVEKVVEANFTSACASV